MLYHNNYYYYTRMGRKFRKLYIKKEKRMIINRNLDDIKVHVITKIYFIFSDFPTCLLFRGWIFIFNPVHYLWNCCVKLILVFFYRLMILFLWFSTFPYTVNAYRTYDIETITLLFFLTQICKNKRLKMVIKCINVP